MNVTRWGIKITDGPRGSVGVYMDVFSDGKYVLLTDYRRGVAEARAAALRDAAAAVKALCDCEGRWNGECSMDRPVAAIEALGGKQ